MINELKLKSETPLVVASTLEINGINLPFTDIKIEGFVGDAWKVSVGFFVKNLDINFAQIENINLEPTLSHYPLFIKQALLEQLKKEIEVDS